ncbi:amidohydrolase [Arthrobacter sp. ZGTC412]|uniref:amidohydrolase n=1 Tax=Arthrobacter sp. ZGTC412 TaxID=2058900 RepID=UPI000CE462A7|nr:amidohydrolase [Arthrobacter sp. ZGTC412]
MTATLFANATFHTLNQDQPQAEAILVEDGVIVAAGTTAQLRAHAPAGTKTVGLGNAVVIPGLTDAHIHTASLARSMHEVDLRQTRSLVEALAEVAAVKPRYREGEWILGGWWDFNAWEIPVQPDRATLDSLCPKNPVALTSADGHTVWANSQALQLLGITRTTPDPAGGEIVRNAHGDATGILRESAVYPVRKLAASGVSGNLADQLREAQQYLLSLGLTGVHDIDGADALEGYRHLRDENALALRVHKLLAQDDLEAAILGGIRTGKGDSWIRHGAVKIFADGAAGSHTCHMSEPFPGSTSYGMEVTAYPELLRLATRAATAGIAVAVHAIGDRANHLVLNALEDIKTITAQHNLRHRIEHVQFLKPADVPRLNTLGVVASMQPQHCPSDLPILGMVEGRDLASYAWRSLLDTGATVAFGSDSPVEVPNPFHGLHAAITRTTAKGEPDGGWEPQERITLEEALHAYCAAPAYASGEENIKGTLSPGKLADFAVLDTDIFAASPAELRETRVLMTVTGGSVRYRLED